MQDSSKSPHLVEFGVIVKAHGLKGEVSVKVFSPDSQTLRPGLPLILRRNSGPDRTVLVESCRWAAQGALVRLQDITDRTAAEALRGCLLLTHREELPALPDGEFYYHDLMGLPVNLPDGRCIGTVHDVFHAATDILVIHGSSGELMVPIVEGFVLSIDREQVVVDAERSGLDLPDPTPDPA